MTGEVIVGSPDEKYFCRCQKCTAGKLQPSSGNYFTSLPFDDVRAPEQQLVYRCGFVECDVQVLGDPKSWASTACPTISLRAPATHAPLATLGPPS